MGRFFAVAALTAGLTGGCQILRGASAWSDGHTIDGTLHYVGAGILLTGALAFTFISLFAAEPREPK